MCYIAHMVNAMIYALVYLDVCDTVQELQVDTSDEARACELLEQWVIACQVVPVGVRLAA